MIKNKLFNCILVILLFIIIRCGENRNQNMVAQKAAQMPEEKIIKSVQDNRIFDSSGQLIPSEKQVFGVVLPRGNLFKFKGYKIEYYTIEANNKTVQNYFRKMVKSVEISKLGNIGWEIKNGTPNPPGDESRKVDIKVVFKKQELTEFIIIDRTPLPGDNKVLTNDDLVPNPEKINKAGVQKLPPEAL